MGVVGRGVCWWATWSEKLVEGELEWLLTVWIRDFRLIKDWVRLEPKVFGVGNWQHSFFVSYRVEIVHSDF